ncbi:glycosyltransferase [Christiangramia sp. SM2212]|uniref:Glycosyltransferase n=1 Tax=Christiangramia sediminicola TaxID=3073267 RepID=A0ABU1ELN6_9FLAO|nr:glycosyltransferase [Christiangramia sp. SM2212]MDR5589300.1 glycosyltransferase [Christiangramia sp. SM2212]
MRKKRILVAALNWGLGHAARCIPIIRELQLNGFEPVIASDGQALELLKKEFPHLNHIELPSYNIQYSKNGFYLKWKMIMDSPRIVMAIREEKKLTKEIVKKYNIKGIISDNRLGVRCKKLKTNVFITHQLNVLSGNTSFLSSYLHQQYISKFDECWVPDVADKKNLSGILGHLKRKPVNVKYIGPISRLEKRNTPEFYDFLVLLSGPEPQRSILESILLKEFKTAEARILFVRGVFSEDELDFPNCNINIKNNLFGKALQEAINASRYIVSRSGYTTLMDLAKLEKKAFFIPTPGQNEQEYLAERLSKLGIAPFCKQEDFDLTQLRRIENYEGLSDFGNHVVFRDLFSFFERK